MAGLERGQPFFITVHSDFFYERLCPFAVISLDLKL